jgi:hypothetical protein
VTPAGTANTAHERDFSVEPTKTNSRQTLLLWSGPIVAGHFIAVVWHLLLVLKVQPGFPRFVAPLLILVNLIPVTGLVALGKGVPKLAGSLITLPLAIALVIGVYAHFLSPGTDNIFRLPPADLRLPFQISAVPLVLLEALGCWIGVWIFVHASEQKA